MSDRDDDDGTDRRLVSGWVGRYFEDVEEGDITNTYTDGPLLRRTTSG